MNCKPILDRFWDKVEFTIDCWNWKGCLTSAGYGQISIDKKRVYSHRFTYELYYDKIPNNKEIRIKYFSTLASFNFLASLL